MTENSTAPARPQKHIIAPDLLHQLKSGFGAASESDRSQGGAKSDNHPATKRAISKVRDSVHESPVPRVARPDGAHPNEVAATFAENASALRSLLHNPWRAFIERPAEETPLAHTEAQSWRSAARLIDEMWRYVNARSVSDHRMADLAPLAARARFILLSYPFRLAEERSAPYWGRNGTANDVFGKRGGRAELTRRAMEARTVWTSYLRTYQSVPSFAAAAPSAVEDELKWVVARGGSWSNRLVLEPDQTTPLPRDEAFAEEAVEGHLLPRFALGAASSAVTAKRWAYPLLWGAALAVPLLLLFGVDARAAAAGAGAIYVGIGVWAVFGRRLATAPLLLRIPAAATVGLILLVALHPDWWSNVDWSRSYVGTLAVLIIASYGYLVIQCRNHCSGELAREPHRVATAMHLFLGRPFLVLAIGAVHSFLIALIGLAFVAPVFSELGDGKETVLAGLEGAGTAILAGATAWCLAAGVFSQILWDDQPITAPLAHQRWRRT